MILSSVAAWIEEADKFPTFLVVTRGVRTLGTVGIGAAPAGILQSRRTMVLLGANVIDFVRERFAGLGKPAILAHIACAFPNLISSRLRHGLVRVASFL